MFRQHKLAWGLVVVHALWCVLIFGLAVNDPERSGLMPVLVYLTDYPASVLAKGLGRALRYRFLDVNFLLIYSGIFLTVGSVWFYCVGRFLEWLLLGPTPTKEHAEF